MPVGHERINDPNANPNPNITFIRALADKPDSDKATEMLEAVAAQFRPITRSWGFGINSLQEHEWNPTFGGRNWNAGEIIELVIRRKDGSFLPFQFILFVMCHELAHIKEMNHSWAFKKVNAQIRRELSALRASHYYGDGFWSKGRSLTSGRNEAEYPVDQQPAYTCGGANHKGRKRRAPRKVNENGTPRAARGSAKVGLHTGRQTAIPKKAGGRVKRAGAFAGEGVRLDDDPEQSTFRKQAGSKSAAQMRADIFEARLQAERAAKEGDMKPDTKGKGKEVITIDSSDEEGQDIDYFSEDEMVWLEEDKKTWMDEVEVGGEDEDEFWKGDSGKGRLSNGKKRAMTLGSSPPSTKRKTSKAPRHGRKLLSDQSNSDVEPPPKKIRKKSAPSTKAKGQKLIESEEDSAAPAVKKVSGKGKEKGKEKNKMQVMEIGSSDEEDQLYSE